MNDGSIAGMYFAALGKQFGFTLDTPVKALSKDAKHALLYGTGDKKLRMERPTSFGGGTYYTAFEGVINNLKRRYNESQSELSRNEIEQFMTTEPCPECGGARLSKEALSVTVGGLNIDAVTRLSVEKELAFFEALPGFNDLLEDRRIVYELFHRIIYFKADIIVYRNSFTAADVDCRHFIWINAPL